MKIYSEVGHGTALKIYLRRAAAKVAEAQRSQQVEVLPTGHVGELVLVVEDEAAVRRHTVEALRELGYTVRHAASGEEALKLLEQAGAVTLLFTDVVMPGISGRLLADVARTTQPDLKVLYTTGYTQNAIVHNCVLDPGVELISKPFTIDQLARKVEESSRGIACSDSHILGTRRRGRGTYIDKIIGIHVYKIGYHKLTPVIFTGLVSRYAPPLPKTHPSEAFAGRGTKPRIENTLSGLSLSASGFSAPRARTLKSAKVISLAKLLLSSIAIPVRVGSCALITWQMSRSACSSAVSVSSS